MAKGQNEGIRIRNVPQWRKRIVHRRLKETRPL